jgi:hypothetical protein
MPTITLRQLGRATLARQMLLTRSTAPLLRAVEALGGLQAQWPKPPFLGLWSRLETFASADLVRALTQHELVRATLMRGTLHVASAKDFLAWRPVLQPVLTRGMNAALKTRKEGLVLERVVADARDFLAGGPRTFTEIREHLQRLHPKANDRALGFSVRTHLPLVQVPDDSRWAFPADPRFTLAKSWLKKDLTAVLDPGPLLLRYLAAFGPASIADMQAWTGLQGLAPTVKALRPKLEEVKDEGGRVLFDLAQAERPEGDAPVRFLPEYDSAIVARADARLLATKHRTAVFRPGLRVLATFLVDGAVSGTWAIERKKNAATLVLAPFAALSRSVRAQLEEEGDCLLRFAEADAQVFAVK